MEILCCRFQSLGSKTTSAAKKLLILFGQKKPLNSRRHKLGLVEGSLVGDRGTKDVGRWAPQSHT